MSRLQRELVQTRPFASVAEEAFLSLLRTAEHLRAKEHEVLREHGLSGPQYNVLRILRGAGEDGHACQAIVARMIARVPDVTRLVDRLADAGLVERTRGVEDRRVVRVRIRPAGLALLARIDAPLAAAIRRMFAPLARRDQQQFVDLLARLRGGDGEDAHHQPRAGGSRRQTTR